MNHVIFVGDPLYPIFLTGEATRQGYNPEWMITGTGLLDTTFFGRTYDQNQWGRAFGMSPLWVFSEDAGQSSGWRTLDHVKPGSEKGAGANVVQSPIQLIFTGIHYAGPNAHPGELRRRPLRGAGRRRPDQRPAGEVHQGEPGCHQGLRRGVVEPATAPAGTS